jgi:hypothetical protein
VDGFWVGAENAFLKRVLEGAREKGKTSFFSSARVLYAVY